MDGRRTSHFVAGLAFVALSGVCLGDDTDIYLDVGNRLPPGSEPMIMFSLDYRPNLGNTACNNDVLIDTDGDGIEETAVNECHSLIEAGYMSPTGSYTFFDVLRGALKKVFQPLSGVKVGLMLNHYPDNACGGPHHTGCSNGGYIAMGFQPFDESDSNGAKAKFHAILDAMPTPQGRVSHLYQGKELFFELFRYLTGQKVYNGHNGWTDYATDAVENLDVDGAGYAWDSSVEAGANYVSALNSATECTNIYTVNPLFQVSSQEDDSDAAIQAPVASGGLGVAAKDFENVLAYLNDADLADGTYGSASDIEGKQNVTSYFLVDPSKINKTTTSYAKAGGSGVPLPLSDNPDELVATLEQIFKQILSVSTTFVAASVPINVFNRAQINDNVFIALFQVNGDLRPAWTGNLKKLRLSTESSHLVDALGNPAVAANGRIREDALTFWTLPDALPPADTSIGEVEGRDGRSVARGGAGQRVPGFVTGSPGSTNGPGNRQLFYDNGATLAPLNADSTTASALQADLGAASTGEAALLIEFARGLDVDDLDGDGVEDEAREWIFNDPLHSRPLPLNYGARGSYTQSNPAIYLAVASNDGFLHFIRNTEPDGSQSGREAWAFMPRSAMGALKTLRANGVGVPHPYTVDGSPVAYIEDLNHNGTIESGESAYLYIGMRRGGKAYYALDVSDPENLAFMWSIEKGGDFAELGYTFSNPRVGQVDVGAGPQPVLVFAGGYDMNKDARGTVGTDDSEGNAIYVVDARTGELIWKARGGTGGSGNIFEHPDLVDSIPSPVTVADTDGDLLIDRIIVGDSGGNVWRADLPGMDVSQWKLTLLASLGRHAEAGKQNDRRFFHRPDLVPAQDEHGAFDAVLIGSGDRADPLDSGGVVTNWFYMIKDRNVTKGSGTDIRLEPSDLGDVTDNCLQEGGICSVDVVNGWRLQLEERGEKSLATPLTMAGTVFFTTYLPSSEVESISPCLPAEGSGRLYAVDLQNASSVINYDTTDDEIAHPNEATTKSDRSTALRAPGIPAEVVSIPPNKILRPDLQIDDLDVTTRWRTFWYLREDTDL